MAEVAVLRPRIFSSINLIMRYYTTPISKESRQLTTFVLSWRKYQFCKLSFRLSTVPDIFQATMDKLFNIMPFVKVYLNDILVVSTNSIEYLSHLREVLAKLEKANLTINVEKSQFFKTSVEYLGF